MLCDLPKVIQLTIRASKAGLSLPPEAAFFPKMQTPVTPNGLLPARCEVRLDTWSRRCEEMTCFHYTVNIGHTLSVKQRQKTIPLVCIAA